MGTWVPSTHESHGLALSTSLVCLRSPLPSKGSNPVSTEDFNEYFHVLRPGELSSGHFPFQSLVGWEIPGLSSVAYACALSLH